MCLVLLVYVQTYQLFVAAVQRHVAEGCGDRAHNPVIVHPQQLHQDRQPFLLTHCSSDIGRELDTHTALLHKIPITACPVSLKRGVPPSSFQQTGFAETQLHPPAWRGWSFQPAGWGTASPPLGATAALLLLEVGRNLGLGRCRPTVRNTSVDKQNTSGILFMQVKALRKHLCRKSWYTKSL